MTYYTDTVLDQNNRPLAGIGISVYIGTSNVLATVTDDGGVPLTQPFYTDIFGAFAFNADAGSYIIRFTRGGVTVREDTIFVGGNDVVNTQTITSALGYLPASPASLDTKVDRYPATAYSSLSGVTDALYQNWLSAWWDSANNHLRPTNGGGIENGRAYTGTPSMWQSMQALNVLYERWKSGDTDAGVKVGQQWTYLRSVFSAADLKLGFGVTQNISDDAAWMALGYAQIHEVTGDALALSYLIELIPGTTALYHDPLQTQTNHGYTTPGGIAFKSDPFGILYAKATDTAATQTYGYISTIYEAYLALAALYVFKVDPTKTAFRDYALQRWQWARTYMRTPAPINASKSAQGIYYTDFNLDPNVANSGAITGTAQPQEVYHLGKNAWFGRPLRGVSAPYDGGTIAMAILSADLFDLTGEAAYLTEANSIVAAYPLPNAFGRTIRGVSVIGNLRDPWTNGYPFARFARTVLNRTAIDTGNIMRRALRNTGKVVAAQAVASGYLTADWGGPEQRLGTANFTWAQDSFTGYGGSPGGGAAAPDQIMTHSTSLTLLMGAAQIGAGVSYGSAVDAQAIEDLPAEIGALWAALQSKADTGGQRFTGRISFDGQNYTTLYNGNPFWNADAGDFNQFDRTANIWQWFVNGNEAFRVDSGGASVYNALTAEASVSVRSTNGNYPKMMRINGKAVYVLAPGMYVSGNTDKQAIEFIVGDAIVGHVKAGGFAPGAAP